MSSESTVPARFSDFGLAESVLKALSDAGYETPTAIQVRTIPHVLEGKDVLAQAQTGTGKTAAFVAPLLSRIKVTGKLPRILVLAPTRELAIQVAESFKRYGKHVPGLRVATVYGGTGYQTQMDDLRRGVSVVVGTPGRVMDHMRQGRLRLDALEALVLDEADEMLRAGFIEDIEWVLEQSPEQRQLTLFSATMPPPIRQIAQKYLRDPVRVTTETKPTAAASIRQRYVLTSERDKLGTLARLLEVEETEGVLVFVRTRARVEEVAEQLEKAGHHCAGLSGAVAQTLRERTLNRLRSGQLDVIVATDVAARGLDVERISHVINYDIPREVEVYVHRIGRTGRAGRVGEAILLVSRHQRRQLDRIEQVTRQRVSEFQFPSNETLNRRRIDRFKQGIQDALGADGLEVFEQVVEEFQEEHGVSATRIAAALARKIQGAAPLLLEREPAPRASSRRAPAPAPRPERERAGRGPQPTRSRKRSDGEMESYRIEVGTEHKVTTGNIVGALANEGGLDARDIGRIEVRGEYSLVELPGRLPAGILANLKTVWVANRQLGITVWKGESAAPRPKRPGRVERDEEPRRANASRGTARKRAPGSKTPESAPPEPRAPKPRSKPRSAASTPRKTESSARTSKGKTPSQLRRKARRAAERDVKG